MDKSRLPLAYSCSGCSNVAQIANRTAIALDRKGLVEMSCIAGVGGDVPSLVKTAKSGRPVIAIDGCPLQCVKKTLARHGVSPSTHYTLTDWGLRKRSGENYKPSEAKNVFKRIASDLQGNRIHT